MALQQELLDLRDPPSEVKPHPGDDSEAQVAAAEEPKKDAKEVKQHLEELRRIIARAAAAAATKRKDMKSLRQHLEVAELDSLIKAQWLADAGDLEEPIKIAEKAVKDDESQVRPLAILVDLFWRSDRKEEAVQQFNKLRTVAGHADLETPLLAKLTAVAEAAGVQGDWRTPPAPADDLGDRPPLDQLGPFRWQPYPAPSWSARNASNDLVGSEAYDGRPRILIFYLGFGCLHCVEQLHTFSPMLESFRSAGIDVVAISTETVDELQVGIKNFDEAMEIPLLADGEHETFRSFRCWDDFENQPLHGTFLIDAQGRVRWQDISYEPFNEPEFLLQEAKRLLALP